MTNEAHLKIEPDATSQPTSTDQRVIITGIQIPFWSLAGFIIKFAVALLTPLGLLWLLVRLINQWVTVMSM